MASKNAKLANMILWDAVCKTDPKHTKKVNQRGGFTAIDAHYQVQEATRQFGPIGEGWGFDFELLDAAPGTIIAKVTLWHGKPDQTITQCGQKKINTAKGPDEDAAKKAVTDGLTKCLSYLGFNADVFLGKFDDNKYVQDMTKEHDPEAKEFNEWSKQAIVDLESIGKTEELTKWLKENKAKVDNAMGNPALKANAMAVLNTYKKAADELKPQEEAA